MNRLWRRIGGWAGIVALVFAQMAVSAYACPALTVEAEAPASVSMPCHDPDGGTANLCQKHCHDSQQSQSAAASMPAAFSAAFVAIVPQPATSVAATVACLDGPALLHANSPPPSIRNCCLRI